MGDCADVISQARDALERYLDRFPAERDDVAPLRAQLAEDREILLRSNMRGHITTSALVLDADATRALLVHHRTFDAWLQPGGHYEPPGSLFASACREVAEETGLQALRAYSADDERDPLDIDTHPIPAHPGKREASHWHHDFAYLAIAEGPFRPTPQVEEVHDVAWIALDEVLRYPNARLRRVARKALRRVAGRRRA